MEELFEGNAESADRDFVFTRGESVTTVPGTEVVVLDVVEEDVEEPECVVEVTPVTVGLGEGVIIEVEEVDEVSSVGV
jgi:hypothetical protein